VLRHSLRATILAAYLLSSLAFVGALSYGLIQLQRIGQGLAVIDSGYLPLARTAAWMEFSQTRLVEGPQIGARTPFVALQLRQLDEACARGLRTVEEALPITRQPEEVATLRSLADQLRLIQEVVGQLQDDAKDDPTRAQHQAELETEITQFASRVEASIRRVSERTGETQRRGLVVSAALTTLALAFGVVMLLVAAGRLRPIAQLTREVQHIADGSYDTRVQLDRTDELGVLADAIDQMAASIQQRNQDLGTRAQELDQARLHLRSVLDSIRLGLIVVEDHAVAMANPAALELWGAEEGAALPEALSFDGERADALVIGDRTFEIRRVPFGGGAILVGEDVTDSIASRQRLARSERLALVGQLLAQVTHEVRNPLNALSLNAELLDEELDGLAADRQQEARAILQTMTTCISTLEQVTGRYLDLARRPHPEPEPSDPVAVVTEVTQLLEEELRRQGVTLSLAVAKMPKSLEIDAAQIRQALINVVRNAAEAGARNVDIRLEQRGDELHVAIRDDGEGMSDETVKRASEPFFTTKATGTGLGLAITRQVIEDHGGRLQMTSTQDGTEIRLILPV
jgi:nitrogen fixation/metabolism regulation signal transduction histidine kinase